MHKQVLLITMIEETLAFPAEWTHPEYLGWWGKGRWTPELPLAINADKEVTSYNPRKGVSGSTTLVKSTALRNNTNSDRRQVWPHHILDIWDSIWIQRPGGLGGSSAGEFGISLVILMKPFKRSSPLEGLFWGLVDVSPLSSKAWSWLLTDTVKVARSLRPSCFIPGAESFHPEIVQHFPHEQLHSDLVPSMNLVPCQEYSQVRQHVDHCPDQEDTQVHGPTSQKWEELLLW